MAISYPLAMLDFEASSLEHDSYPIEVGLAICEQVGAPIRTWSTLIRPHNSWSLDGAGRKGSQHTHGILGEEYADGTSVRHTMEQLNALLAPIGTALCDGGDYYRFWLARLSEAAGIEPMFALGGWEQAFGADHEAFKQAEEWLGSYMPPHRAETDAVRLLDAIFHQMER